MPEHHINESKFNLYFQQIENNDPSFPSPAPETRLDIIDAALAIGRGRDRDLTDLTTRAIEAEIIFIEGLAKFYSGSLSLPSGSNKNVTETLLNEVLEKLDALRLSAYNIQSNNSTVSIINNNNQLGKEELVKNKPMGSISELGNIFNHPWVIKIGEYIGPIIASAITSFLVNSRF